jgi:hypothetical protein
MNESQTLFQEKTLRKWFTREADPILAEVDGLDIGWGGVQRWATRRMPSVNRGMHIDFACGFGKVLAQLGWRFPDAQLIGLNLYTGEGEVPRNIGGIPSFEVDDIETLRVDVERLGIRHEVALNYSEYFSFLWIFYPDGNKIEFVKLNKGRLP